MAVARAQWTLIGGAPALDGSIRAGLEDEFHPPHGTLARSNGELVARARGMAEDAGRRVAAVEEARAMLA